MLFFFLWFSYTIWIHCVSFLKVCYILYLISFFCWHYSLFWKRFATKFNFRKKLKSEFLQNTAYFLRHRGYNIENDRSTECIQLHVIIDDQNSVRKSQSIYKKKNKTENERKRKFPFYRNASHVQALDYTHAFGWLFNYSLRILLCSFFVNCFRFHRLFAI